HQRPSAWFHTLNTLLLLLVVPGSARRARSFRKRKQTRSKLNAVARQRRRQNSAHWLEVVLLPGNINSPS
uniref:Uncharacterized protein n=1 Tax=Myripristis murdjan TaxID=586833 RepID=A0A667YLR1_9TELE